MWEIARARKSPTKFIVTDEPVTFFNRRLFPAEDVYPGQIDLDLVGTRTLFPLGLDSCLIITHLQLARNPRIDPIARRVNARAYETVMKSMQDIQFGREFGEDEVLRINYILKRRATRYIAAAEEKWLYPELHGSTTNWSKLDDDWFLFPHLWKVPFTREITVGYQDGSAWASDEHGRHPGDPKYKDKELRDREWHSRIWAQREWAKKRAGRSLAHIEDFTRADRVADEMMQEYLEQEALTQL